MKPSDILKYYMNDNIINKLLNVKDRECAARYYDKFGKRPMLFQYPSDIEVPTTCKRDIIPRRVN